ncbi:hypothetical protein [Jannaschia aquimarina]|nr:hypothetical protein [Jannaschia aquimarina]
MTEAAYISPEIRMGLEAARKAAHRHGRRLRVQVGDIWYPIRSMDDDGIEIALDVAPKLRGHIEIHEGPRVIRTALIVAAEVRDDVMRYAFKRATAPRNEAPVDYVRLLPASAGLIEVQ